MTLKKKQVVKMVSLILSTVLLFVLVGLLTFNNQYNKWPFNKGKIKGIPNNTIVKLEETEQFNNLLFPVQESLKFNAQGNKVVVYMERYEKSVLKESRELLALSADTAEDSDLAGSIQWGMVDWGVTEDNLKLGLLVNDKELTTNYTLKTKKDSIGVNSGMSYGSLDLVVGQPVLIGFWGAGENQIVTVNYEDLVLDKDELEINSESFALFIEIK